ncbi:MAG: BatD family protein [Flavobacteriaceae bacterium]|nr:BatD family protein [Flavobacteriaceae bacterium]
MKYFFSLLCCVHFMFSQTLSSSLDKNTIELGETLTMKINIRNLQGKKVVALPSKELLPFFSEETRDEIAQNTEQYSRIIEFSIFDEGKFFIPALEFKVGDSILKSIPYEIEVKNSAQPNDEINDIMPIQEIDLNFLDYFELYKSYILLILFVLILGVAIVFFKKKRNFTTSLKLKNPNEKSISALQILKQKNYIENSEFRLFYVEFLEIIRSFLNEKYQIPAHILLTDDLMENLKENSQISPENKQMLADVFMRGDWAKFAKMTPSKEIAEADFYKIINWIKAN